MRTTYVTPDAYAREALRLAKETKAVGELRPLCFWEVMRKNRGLVESISPYGPSDDGLERKNPVVVALGDSVTAGHFEFCGDPEELFAKADAGLLAEDEAVDVTDARECYLERFRQKLIDKYEHTSVSTINAGIAGDTIYGMQNRLYRDVIRYQPDLVLLNGSLNWGVECGELEAYERTLTQVIRGVKAETKADLVLMTPNMDWPSPLVHATVPLIDRVHVIREVAKREQVCLADTYLVWERYRDEGYPVEALLANGVNHPSVTGHEMYALVLMQLMEEG